MKLSFEEFITHIGLAEGEKFNSCHSPGTGQFCSGGGGGGGASAGAPSDIKPPDAQGKWALKNSPNGWAIIEALGGKEQSGNKVDSIIQHLKDNGWKNEYVGGNQTYVRRSQRNAPGKRIDFDYNSDTGKTWLEVRDYLG